VHLSGSGREKPRLIALADAAVAGVPATPEAWTACCCGAAALACSVTAPVATPAQITDRATSLRARHRWDRRRSRLLIVSSSFDVDRRRCRHRDDNNAFDAR
jgi:hypothetical protein